MSAEENSQEKNEESLKRTAHALQPAVRIGKNGITNEILAEIEKQLKKHKLVKIKLLQNFVLATGKSKKEIAQRLATEMHAKLIHTVGGTMTLFRE